MALSWVHCNNCYLLAAVQNSTRRENFALASCGHIFCSTCLEKCGKKCTVCGRSPFIYENVGHQMSEKTKKFFQAPNALLMNALKKVNSVIKFQQNQYNIIRKNFSGMHEQMNDMADRCKETAKICGALERDANSFLSNVQRHHGMLQHMNNSFAACAQNWKYFEDVRENVNTLRSMDLKHHQSQENSEELSKASSFFVRNGSFNSNLSLSERSLSDFNATTSKSYVHCSDVGDLSKFCHQSAKASGDLTVLFSDKDRCNEMNLSRLSLSSNISNPYMQYISQKNAHLSAAMCSTEAQNKKDALNLQQLGGKRRPNMLQNIQLPQDAFKVESSVHGLFNVRTHSLSRSPPRKSSRPDDH